METETTRLTLQEYLTNIKDHGILGHVDKLLCLDPNDERVNYAELFWMVFDSIAHFNVGGYQSVVPISDEENKRGMWQDMETEIKYHYDHIETYTEDKKKELLHAFVVWENAAIDSHTLNVGLTRKIYDAIEVWELANDHVLPYKMDDKKAIEAIEKVLSRKRERSLTASEALDEIMEISVFAERKLKKVN